MARSGLPWIAGTSSLFRSWFLLAECSRLKADCGDGQAAGSEMLARDPGVQCPEVQVVRVSSTPDLGILIKPVEECLCRNGQTFRVLRVEPVAYQCVGDREATVRDHLCDFGIYSVETVSRDPERLKRQTRAVCLFP